MEKQKKLNTFGTKILYYLRDSIFTYTYILVAGFLGVCFMYMQNNGMIPSYVTVIFSVLNVLLYAVVVRNIFLKTGEDARTLKHSNDVERRHMIETDNYYELDKVKEYDIKKPIVFSVISAFVLAVLLLIKLIGVVFVGEFFALDAGIKFFAGMVYPIFYAFNPEASVFYGAIQIIVMAIPIFMGYVVGGIRANKVYERAEKIKKEIGGEN